MKREGPPLDAITLETIGRRLRAEAGRLNLTQQDIATVSGRTRGAVNHWFHGRNMMDLAALHKIGTKWPDLAVEYILYGRPQDSPEVRKLAKTIGAMSPEQRKALAEVFSSSGAADQAVRPTARTRR